MRKWLATAPEHNINILRIIFPFECIAKSFNCVAICNAEQVILRLDLQAYYISNAPSQCSKDKGVFLKAWPATIRAYMWDIQHQYNRQSSSHVGLRLTYAPATCWTSYILVLPRPLPTWRTPTWRTPHLENPHVQRNITPTGRPASALEWAPATWLGRGTL